MANILIIGIGNIGFYHLYSIYSNNKSNKYNIYAVDKDSKILTKIKKKKIQNIFLFDEIEKLPNIKFDILILSTTASERYIILKKFLKLFFVKYIIFEKVAFNSLKEIKLTKKILLDRKIKSWVNCNYQTIPFFRDLIKKINKNNFELRIFGGNWSLGTSAIHFLDLFTFLSQKNIDTLQFSSLSKKIYKAKRNGYFEFEGKFIGQSYNNNKLSIEKFTQSSMPLQITLKTKEFFILFEDGKRKVNLLSKDNNWKLQSSTILFPYQSELTSNLIEQLIINKTCQLPTFESSIKNHILLIKLLKKKFIGTNLVYNDRVNIT